jgi:hypothetical protein
MTGRGIKAQIGLELYEAARKLGAKSDLLSIIGSYGDTLSDQEVLDALRQWNEAYPAQDGGVYGEPTPFEDQEHLGPKPLPGIP